MNRSMLSLNPVAILCVMIGLALVLPVLPFAYAIGLVLAFCLWAGCQVFLWHQALRRSRNVRAFIQRELDKMPRRDEPTRRQVLTHVSMYPEAWQPFVEHDGHVRAHAR